MITSLNLKNFTVFSEASFQFGMLNVIHGINGSGKTQLLKLLYSSLAVLADAKEDRPIKSRMQRDLAEKLIGVFKPDKLGRLARRIQGHQKCSIVLRYEEPAGDLEFSFSTNSSSEVAIESVPPVWQRAPPVFLPARELLSLQPELVGLLRERHLPFDDTWLDTSMLLTSPLAKGPRLRRTQELLSSLEDAMEGSLTTDKAGRFYLDGIEMHLVAEGHRKLATIARLIVNGSLSDKVAIFWDEPEANLNPRLIKTVAPLLLKLATSGIQVFVATHSLFLLDEICAQCRTATTSTRYFGLHRNAGEVAVEQGNTLAEAGELAALQEELAQADRLLPKRLDL